VPLAAPLTDKNVISDFEFVDLTIGVRAANAHQRILWP
jgi:hypothetical protein